MFQYDPAQDDENRKRGEAFMRPAQRPQPPTTEKVGRPPSLIGRPPQPGGPYGGIMGGVGEAMRRTMPMPPRGTLEAGPYGGIMGGQSEPPIGAPVPTGEPPIGAPPPKWDKPQVVGDTVIGGPPQPAGPYGGIMGGVQDAMRRLQPKGEPPIGAPVPAPPVVGGGPQPAGPYGGIMAGVGPRRQAFLDRLRAADQTQPGPFLPRLAMRRRKPMGDGGPGGPPPATY